MAKGDYAPPPEVTLGALGTKWCPGRIDPVGGHAPMIRPQIIGFDKNSILASIADHRL